MKIRFQGTFQCIKVECRKGIKGSIAQGVYAMETSRMAVIWGDI